MNYEGIWCPCCGNKLRTNPRQMYYKLKLRASKQEVELIQVRVKRNE